MELPSNGDGSVGLDGLSKSLEDGAGEKPLATPKVEMLTLQPPTTETLGAGMIVQGECSEPKGSPQDAVDVRPGSYEGGTDSEGRRHGRGTCEFAAGGRYDGEWQHGNIHGHGEYIFPWGDVYVGSFKDGKRHGEGDYTYASGNKYVGNFKDNQRHGLGRYSYRSGAEYDGAFAFDLRHGYGRYIFPNGDVYEGDYAKGQMHGYGTFTQVDGSVYRGNWSEGKMHGRGTFAFASGAKYDGEYVAGRMHGHGLYTFANGDVFRGEYEADHMRRGTFLFASGDHYDGEFRKGKMHGKGVFRSAHGDVYNGEFANDLKHGRGVLLLSNGMRFEGNFADGKKNGVGRVCSAGGEWTEGEWKNGKQVKSQPPMDAIRGSSTPPPSPKSTKNRQRKQKKKTGSSGALDEPILIQWSDATMSGIDDQHGTWGSQVSRVGARVVRKAPTYYQKYPVQVPPSRDFSRRAGAFEVAGSSPGAWTQRSRPSQLLSVARRYGIPQRLMRQLAMEAGAEQTRLQGGDVLEGAFPELNARPSSAPTDLHERRPTPVMFDPRVRSSGRPQSAINSRDRIRSSAGATGGDGSRAHVHRRVPATNDGGALSASQRTPDEHSDDPEMASWLAENAQNSMRSNTQLWSSSGSDLHAEMSPREAEATDTWHPAIPRPMWAAPAPPRAQHQPPMRHQRGSYGRAHHRSLQGVSDMP